MLCIGVLLALSSVGCGAAGPDVEAEQVERTVAAYNQALSRAFESLDMNELNQVATEDQATTEYFLMAALGEGRLHMFATLVSIEYGEVTFPEDGTASVTTTEVWDYEHVSLDTSETVRVESGIVYHLRYDLVFQDRRWLVAGVTSLDETESRKTSP